MKQIKIEIKDYKKYIDKRNLFEAVNRSKLFVQEYLRKYFISNEFYKD